MEFSGNILLIGGTGTLGTEFMKAATLQEWDCKITVFSRDWKKQKELKRHFPDVTFILGDVLNHELLRYAVAGHDLVIHMAAMKHVVEGEYNPMAVFETNVLGSQNVLGVCADLEVDVVGISTDKATRPHNAYGASKMMMERMFQFYSVAHPETSFHLVRYGNVFGSSGSFIHNWINDLNELGYVRSTNSGMTRFWLTAQDALELIYYSLSEPSGCTLIPKPKAAKVGDIEEWLLPEGVEVEHLGMRPGEKMHECLLSEEEGNRAEFIQYDDKSFVRLHPAWEKNDPLVGLTPMFSSAKHIRMRKEEFLELSGMTGEELADNHS